MRNWPFLILLSAWAITACGKPSPESKSATWNWGRPPTSLFQSELSCKPYQPGESRFIETMDNGLGIAVRYRLRKTPDGFEAVVQPKFVAESGDAADARRLKIFASNCLKKVEPFLQGPNGEKLVIRYSRADETDLPLPVEIRIAKDALLQNWSNHWSPEISCPQIIHETFHLVGLVDEYTDPAYPCRAHGEYYSVMSEYPSIGVSQIAEQYEVRDCSCAAEDTACLESLKKLIGAPAACPDGTIQKTVARYSIPDVDGNRPVAPQAAEGHYQYLLRTQERTRQSLLLPGQFRAITNPACADENESYFACAALANKSKDQCPEEKEIPELCRGFDWAL